MTIREIAKRCGLSRGTVDRVINGRGRVHPDTLQRVLDVLTEVGYSKNIAGRALTMCKAAPVIGVLLSSLGNPFFDEVIEGVRCAEESLKGYGVTVELKEMQGYRVEEQLALIEEMEGRIAALVFQAINDPRVASKVWELSDKGIPTVTVNSDLENSARLCYVGSDYTKGGETAAGIVRLATGGKGRLGIITGVASILGHVQRLNGFEGHLRTVCPDMCIAARASTNDDIVYAYEVTRDMLRADPAIDTLVIITAGLEGVCKAVFEAGREHDVRLFAFDNIPKTEEMMRHGLLKAVVCAQPFQQGYQSIRTAYDIILTGKAPTDKLLMENQIKLLENLSD